VFAIVQYQQPDSALERYRDRLGQGLRRLLCDAEDRSDRIRNRSRIRHCCQFEKPYAVWKFVTQLGGGFQGQSGLADAADTGQGNQPMSADGVFDLGDFRIASDEACRRLP
jgi:hypothetical protein